MIVDDLSSDRSRLNSDISACLSEKKHLHWTIQCFSCAQQMLDTATYSFDSPRIAFLDICMDKMNGIQLARELRSNDPELLIIFLTTSREYAFDAFPLHAFDYLLKPFGMQDFQRAALRLKDRLETQADKAEPAKNTDTPPSVPSPSADSYQDDTLFLKTEYRIVKVAIKDIRYVEDGAEKRLPIREGFVEVRDNQVKVCVEV